MRVQAKLDRLGADFTRIPKFPERSTIYASDGETVLATVYLDNREIVRLKKISPDRARGGARDRGLRLLRARRAELELAGARPGRERPAGQVVQGGSTITQQLVKNTLGASDAQSFERKFQELALAIRVEEKYSKDEILEMYLNEIYFGNGVYGVRHRGGLLLRQAGVGAHARRRRDARRDDPGARVTTTRSTSPGRRGCAATTC